MHDPFRNYDAWKTASPYDEDLSGDSNFRCSCGAFLAKKPIRHKYREHIESDYSPTPPRDMEHVFDIKKIDSPWENGTRWWSYKIRYNIIIAIYRCKRCGKNTELGDW